MRRLDVRVIIRAVGGDPLPDPLVEAVQITLPDTAESQPSQFRVEQMVLEAVREWACGLFGEDRAASVVDTDFELWCRADFWK